MAKGPRRKVFHVPEGYALELSEDLALRYRVWMLTPVLREWAPEHLMARDLAWLVPSPGYEPADRDPVDPAWPIRPMHKDDE